MNANFFQAYSCLFLKVNEYCYFSFKIIDLNNILQTSDELNGTLSTLFNFIPSIEDHNKIVSEMNFLIAKKCCYPCYTIHFSF